MNRPFSYGGQAVIEGVMMRGSKAVAVAVRNPEGKIVVHTEPLNATIYRGPISRIPFVRGLTMLWDALGLGIRALMFSADVATGEEDASFAGPIGWGTVAISMAFSIGLFFVLPTVVGNLVGNSLHLGPLAMNLVEGIVRLALLVGYIWLIGRIPDVNRLFGYHGAEHKTINTYEAGAPLTTTSVAQHSLLHPRCGTAFLLTVAIVSILLFAPLNNLDLWAKIVSRVVLIPLVAGVAYEVIKFTASHQSNPVIRAITIPNLALQKLTTREPDEGMLEVAICALDRVLATERSATAIAHSTILAGELAPMAAAESSTATTS